MLQVLLVDDDATQLKLNRVRLEAAGYRVESTTCSEDAPALAARCAPDAVLSDVLMGGLDGFALCRRLREEPRLAKVPIILLSSHYGGEADESLARRVGASRLVTRTPDFAAELAALAAVLEGAQAPAAAETDPASYEAHLRTNANQLVRLAAQAQTAERSYRALFENATDAISILTPDGTILESNGRWRTLLGVEPASMVGKNVRDYAARGEEVANLGVYRRLVESGDVSAHAVPLQHADGRVIYVEFSTTTVEVDGRPTVLTIGRDVTAQTAAARNLAAAEERYRTLVERLPDVVWTSTVDGTITFITPNARQILGRDTEDYVGALLEVRLLAVHRDDRDEVRTAMQRFAREGVPFDLEYRSQRPDGTWQWLRNRGTAAYERDGIRYLEGLISNVTERKGIEGMLAQAQKMEAIGQLTGGIAHDFNNMLSAILANSYFLMEELGEHDPRRADAAEIKAVTERAAALTRQLLAFSRKQILAPSNVDLNETVHGVEKMLRRLIGEDVDLVVSTAADLGLARVDEGQLEQVIVNLAVNARDAMPEGGRLTIETSNVELDAAYEASHPAVPAGAYVMLSVTDTGTGMTEEVKKRLFEPFFTTKEKGRGTGLGLATCYGIVKQSGGHIWVYSELGHGTVFKVYLPRAGHEPVAAVVQAVAPALGGSETLLIIEDDERVRAAVHRMLRGRGYRTLTAANGDEALAVMATHAPERVDLVVSDVVMPGLSGPEVVAALRARHGELRALFMSGYTDHAMLRSGILDGETNFIQKPFAPETLAKRVREVLDR